MKGGGRSSPTVVICPDKFRGTAEARQVADACERAVMRAYPLAAVRCRPLADGGEGTLELLAEAVAGHWRTTTVAGPLGDPVDASWLLVGRTAYIEMARASGLSLVGGAQGNDPLSASTYGTGELISAAVAAGAAKVVVTVGGSATTDGGFGALRALEPLGRLRSVEIVVATDVQTTFVDAATHFGPQKGATPKQVELLRRRLEHLADSYQRERGTDIRALPGGGAAGGLAGGLASIGASICSGFDLLAELFDLPAIIEDSDLVITGEGFLDEQSFVGKVVGSVYELGHTHNVPTVVVCGQALTEAEWDRSIADPPSARPGLSVQSLTSLFGCERALSETLDCVEAAVLAYLQSNPLSDSHAR